MLRFEALSARAWFLPYLVIQVLIGAGISVLFGFYVPRLTPELAAYLVTGAPALALIPVGLAALPGLTAGQKSAGSYEYLRSLPVPRLASVAATATFFTGLALPGAAAALFLSALRYDVALSLSPLLVPAVLLTSVTAASVGAAIGHGIGYPLLTNLLTNVLLFFVILYSPILFPESHYPDWLVQVNEWLPFTHMASVLRDALTDGLVTDVARSYAVLAAWAAAGLALAGVAVSRRG
jgi:ABC-2 type transport system permease protein